MGTSGTPAPASGIKNDEELKIYYNQKKKKENIAF